MTVRKFAEVVEVGKATAFTQDDPTGRQRRVFIRIGDQLVQFGDIGFKKIDEGALVGADLPSFAWDAVFDENVHDIFAAMAEILGDDGQGEIERLKALLAEAFKRIEELEDEAELDKAEIVTLDRRAAQLDGQLSAERHMFEVLGLRSMIELINGRISG